MKIGIGLDARLGLPFDQLRAAAREAAELGFESVWTPAGGVPDSFHVCAAWSQDTALRTGISVVPAARMWTPLALAAQAATLAQLSAGQFVLGLGTGGYGPGFWASVGLPDRPIAVMREYATEVRGLLADAGAARAGRVPGSVPMTMYIRVCVDDDVAAARRAFGAQVLGYAMGAPGTPPGAGYRGLFGQMGFDAELTELEQRRDRGAALSELVDAAPEEMLGAVGYYGPAAGAPAAFARLSGGLDEAIVRIVTARPGPEPVSHAMAALTPALIRSASAAGS